MSNTKISALPTGTLGTGTIIPAVDVDSGTPTNVQYNLEALLSSYAGTQVTLSGSDLQTLALDPSVFTVAGGTVTANLGTKLTLSGTAETNLALDPTKFAVSGGVLTVTVTGGGSVLTYNGATQNVLAFDTNTFTLSNGTLYVTETNWSNLTAATSLSGTTTILVVQNNTAYTCTLQQLATEIQALTQPSIAITNIPAQFAGNPFTVAGTLSNYSSAPTLYYQDNSGSYTQISGTITNNTFSFTHPALTVGTYTVGVKDGNGVSATSDSFSVAYAIATAATLANVPSTATQGTAITGVTATLTPSYAQAYAVLNNGSDQGSRVAFTGTSVPALTPSSTGTYTIKIYAASTVGSALATSSNITVSAVTATGATVTAPSTAQEGVAFNATVALTPSNATAFACLNNGSDILPRTSFSGTTVSLTPASTGNFTVKIYAASTGGTALATSSNITVGGQSVPTIGSGVAPVFVLDASKASSVTSDTGGTTPQTTNGGAVNAWLDQSGNHYNVSQASSGATLVTNSANGLNGIKFPAGSSDVALFMSTGNAQALGAIFASASQPYTIAITCYYDSTSPSGSAQMFAATASGANFDLGPKYGAFHGIGAVFANDVANVLNTVVMTYNPNNYTGTVWINQNAEAQNVDSEGYFIGQVFTSCGVGNFGADANNILYEIDIWPAMASGVGGASPTGDIATIMNYLNTKWA